MENPTPEDFLAKETSIIEEYEKLSGRSWDERNTFYAAVGQAISLWSSMEGQLVDIASYLLGTSKEKSGLLLYSIMNFHAWLNIIDELFNFEATYSEQKPKWSSISSELRALNDIRVRLAHQTVWETDQASKFTELRPGKFDTRAKSRQYVPLTGAQILVTSQKILKLESQLNDLSKVMFVSSPKKSSGPPNDPLPTDAQ